MMTSNGTAAVNRITAPPHDWASERYLVGALLCFPESFGEVAERVHDGLAHDGNLRWVLRGMLALQQTVGGYDAGLLERWLTAHAELEGAAPVDVLADLAQAAPHAALIDAHLDRLEEFAERRAAIYQARILEATAADPSVDIELVRSKLHSLAGLITTAGRNRGVQFITAAALAAKDIRTEYAVDNLLAAQQFFAIGGPMKCLKSLFSLDLCVSLATGTDVLNCPLFPIPRTRRSAFISCESGEAAIRDGLRRICASKRIDWQLIDNFLLGFDRIDLGDARSVATLERFIEQQHVEFLLLDPLYLMRGRNCDEASLWQMGDRLAVLVEMITRTGCTIGVCHHLRKAQFGQDRRTVDVNDLSGAGVAEIARQWVLLTRREPYDAERGFNVINLTWGGSAGHGGERVLEVLEGTQTDVGGRIWRPALHGLDELREQANAEREREREVRAERTAERHRQKIIETMQRLADAASKTAIRDASGLHSSQFNPPFGELIRDGRVVPCQIKSGNRTVGGFQLSGSNRESREQANGNASLPRESTGRE